MATIKEKINNRLRNQYIKKFHAFMHDEFPKRKFKTEFNILTLRQSTTWDSNDSVECAEIKKIAEAWEAGYMAAKNEVDLA